MGGKGRRFRRWITSKITGNYVEIKKGDLVIILSELIEYAEKRLYSIHTRMKDKPTWARILRGAFTEVLS